MPITYHQWILKQQFTKAIEDLHLSIAIKNNWLDDLVFDQAGIAAIVYHD